MTTRLLVFTGALLAVAGALFAASEGSENASEVHLVRAVHFTGADGSAVVLAPGSYALAQQGEGALAATSLAGTTTLLRAEPTEHDEALDAPLAVSAAAGPDEHHLLVLLPGGTGLDAPGSYSGVVERGSLTRVYFQRIQRVQAKPKGRALLILIENTGDFSSLFPEGSLDAVPTAARLAVTAFLDTLLNDLENTLNFFQTTGRYSKVVSLVDSSATYDNLKSRLRSLDSDGYQPIDVILAAHGSDDSFQATGGTITGSMLRDIKPGRKLNLGVVYQMNCYGWSLTDDWIDLGAKAAAGAEEINWMPEPMTAAWRERWAAGTPFGTALSQAHSISASAWSSVYRRWEVPSTCEQRQCIVPGYNFATGRWYCRSYGTVSVPCMKTLVDLSPNIASSEMRVRGDASQRLF